MEESNILVNYLALPGDESSHEASGIRLGVAEMARSGMVEDDFAPLADCFADVIVRGADGAETLAAYREKFLTVQSCLPAEEAAAIGAQLLASLFPGAAGTRAFAGQFEAAVDAT